MRRVYRFLLMSMITLALGIAVSAASAEEILVYTALEDDQVPRYLESFKKEHPEITVKIVRDSTGIVTAKLLAEKSNPRPMWCGERPPPAS